MCAAPTSEADPPQETWTPAELVKAGWRESDLAWENAAAACLRHMAGGHADAAMEASALALRLARDSFGPEDPRLGTSLANHGTCLRIAGKDTAVASLVTEAEAVWARSADWVARMTAPRVARSSMFHMRMEQLHRDTYEERWRSKWEELAAEGRARVSTLAYTDEAPNAAQARAALARWQRQRPAMLNDTRKLLGAVILLIPST